MKRILLGIGIYLAFLVLTAPAAMLDGIASHLSGGNVRLSGTEGTVWKGSAILGVSGRSSGELSWRILPGELLFGRLHAVLRQNADSMDVVLSPSGIELKHVALTLPASVLSTLNRRMSAVKPGGELHVKADDFVLSASSRGEVSTEWMNASSPLSHVDPLGNYRILARGSDSRIEISLETLQGQLILRGSGFWSEKAGLKFSGTGESSNEGISGLLRIAGKPVSPGVYSLDVE